MCLIGKRNFKDMNKALEAALKLFWECYPETGMLLDVDCSPSRLVLVKQRRSLQYLAKFHKEIQKKNMTTKF